MQEIFSPLLEELFTPFCFQASVAQPLGSNSIVIIASYCCAVFPAVFTCSLT